MKTIKRNWALLVIVLVLGLKYGTAQNRLEVTTGVGEDQNTYKKVSKEVVVTIEDKLAAELYNKANEWLQVTYKNPDKVQKGTIENEYLKFQGSASDFICYNSLGLVTCFDVRYTIELKFKDGRFKFEIISLEQYLSASQFSSGGWYPVTMGWNITKRKGKKEEPYGIRNVQKIESYFNSLVEGLELAMNSDETAIAVSSSNNDW